MELQRSTELAEPIRLNGKNYAQRYSFPIYWIGTIYRSKLVERKERFLSFYISLQPFFFLKLNVYRGYASEPLELSNISLGIKQP